MEYDAELDSYREDETLRSALCEAMPGVGYEVQSWTLADSEPGDGEKQRAVTVRLGRVYLEADEGQVREEVAGLLSRTGYELRRWQITDRLKDGTVQRTLAFSGSRSLTYQQLSLAAEG